MKTSVTFLILSILSIVAEVTFADLEDDLGDDGLPKEVDWRTKGVVTSVKDQHWQNCSSCWAFSTAGALEGQWKIATGDLYNLSVQQLVDCNKANHGCEGGWPARAFSYIINVGGINSEEQYPYTWMDGTCNITKPFVANMTNYEFVTGYNETDLKRAVAEIGPISVAIYASYGSSDSFDNYTGGIFICNKTASIRHSNHAVLVVGYGRTLDDQDYWIVKNSYGTLWGEEGYMRMATNNYTENPCGIANHAFYPVVEKKCRTEFYHWKDRCYHISETSGRSRITWTEARDKCVRLGSNLVTITSQEEQDWIISKAPANWGTQYGQMYIGGSDAASEGTWTWLDGRPWTFSNWDNAGGEPNNAFGGENCAQIRAYNKLWNDISCDSRDWAVYVCSYDPRG